MFHRDGASGYTQSTETTGDDTVPTGNLRHNASPISKGRNKFQRLLSSRRRSNNDTKSSVPGQTQGSQEGVYTTPSCADCANCANMRSYWTQILKEQQCLNRAEKSRSHQADKDFSTKERAFLTELIAAREVLRQQQASFASEKEGLQARIEALSETKDGYGGVIRQQRELLAQVRKQAMDKACGKQDTDALATELKETHLRVEGLENTCREQDRTILDLMEQRDGWRNSRIDLESEIASLQSELATTRSAESACNEIIRTLHGHGLLTRIETAEISSNASVASEQTGADRPLSPAFSIDSSTPPAGRPLVHQPPQQSVVTAV